MKHKYYFLSFLLFTGFAFSAPKPTVVESSPLPAIWVQVPVAQRLLAVRAAELDATRLLAERIYGVQLSGESTVRDLAEVDDNAKAAINQIIRGVKTTEGPNFLEDGRGEVVRAVAIDLILKTVKTIKTKRQSGSTASTTTTTKQDAVLDALGSSAISGSLGHARIMAKRAAEVDAYRRMAERVCGVQIDSETTISGFIVANETIRSKVTSIVKSAETISINYLSDGTAAVTLRLKLGPLIKIIAQTIAKDGKVTTISEETKQMTLEEQGLGAPPSTGEGTPDPITSIEIEEVISNAITKVVP